jgi:hypothetical protein
MKLAGVPLSPAFCYSPLPHQKKTIPSVPCFEHCHVLPLMWDTKFHNHTKPSNNISGSVYTNLKPPNCCDTRLTMLYDTFTEPKTKSLWHSLLDKRNSPSAGQEILHFLWNWKVKYRTQMSRPLTHNPNLENPIHELLCYFVKINFNIIIPPPQRFSKWPLSFKSLFKNTVM